MKPKTLGNVNPCNTATLYKGCKIVGYCNDTPNAVAYSMAETGADLARSIDHEFKREEMVKRVEKRGYFMKNDKDAGLERI